MKKPLLFTAFLLAGTSLTALADDSPENVCKNAAQLYKDGDLEAALEDARWCVSLMEQEKQNQTNTHFKNEIDGYTAGQIQQQSAMGMVMISREYQKGGKRINVEMSGGASGAAASALSMLSQFGMQSGSGRKTRIQQRTAMITEERGSVTIAVTLRSGGFLTFSSSDLNAQQALAFARKFPIKALDESRQ